MTKLPPKLNSKSNLIKSRSTLLKKVKNKAGAKISAGNAGSAGKATKQDLMPTKTSARKSAKFTKSPSLSESELKQLARDVLKQAQQRGASAAAVGVNLGQGYSVMVRHGKAEHIEYDKGKSLGVTVYFGQRIGGVSTVDFSKEAIALALDKACHIARYTNEDPCAGLADAEFMAHGYKDLDLSHPWPLSIERAIKLAQECEAAGLRHDKRIINSDGATIDSHQSFGIYANTHDFLGCSRTTTHSISYSLIAAEQPEQSRSQDQAQSQAQTQAQAAQTSRRAAATGQRRVASPVATAPASLSGGGKMQRDGDYTVARNPALLTHAKTLGVSAARLALRRLGARQIKTRECPVIFEAPVAKSLIGSLLGAVSGGYLYNKTSFLCDCLGKQVIAPHLSIDERPNIPQALGSSAFDSEGVRTKQQAIINDGVLERYILSSYTARKLNLRTTGNCGGCYNIFVKTANPALNFPALLQEMQEGLVVIELLGSGVNMVTGDYSCGAFGLWVERGIIQHPVDGITISGNLKDMLSNIVAMSDDVDKRGTIFTGSLLVSRMQVGGK